MTKEFTLEQEVQCGDCILPPPIACITSNNKYHIKDGDHSVGHIEEESSCLCRTCCMPRARTAENKIKFPNGEYKARKEFRLGYFIHWFCCSRPDVIVEKNGKVVGSIEMPCCPSLLCKLQVDCYSGESREEKDLLWTIKKCCCNCHLLFGKACGCCCEPAGEMKFEIHGKGDGHLEKKHFGVVNECYTMADKYKFKYPTENPDEQAIFLAAIQFIDMLYFEMNYWGAGTI